MEQCQNCKQNYMPRWTTEGHEQARQCQNQKCERIENRDGVAEFEGKPQTEVNVA